MAAKQDDLPQLPVCIYHNDTIKRIGNIEDEIKKEIKKQIEELKTFMIEKKAINGYVKEQKENSLRKYLVYVAVILSFISNVVFALLLFLTPL